MLQERSAPLQSPNIEIVPRKKSTQWSIVWHTPTVNNPDGAFPWLECTQFDFTAFSNLIFKLNSGILRLIEVQRFLTSI
jgi:hypothetical protein